VQITLSLGVAQIQAQESPEALFERADRALYAAKHSGRNRICMSEK
jgi:diguanylate cyclase